MAYAGWLLEYNNTQELSAKFPELYDSFFEQYGNIFGHYFRMMYTVLSFTDGMDSDNRIRSAKLLRAQLSGPEASLLLCNYLSKKTTPEFNSLIVKYGFLKNVDMKDPMIAELLSQIPSRAFGRTHDEAR